MINSGNTVLVTGGAGYIGSHTCVELLESGYQVVVYDNLSNSKVTSLERVQEVTGKELTFIEGDMLDRTALSDLFEKHCITAVIHLADLKAVRESVAMPIEYYQNNVGGTINLLEVMKGAGCRDIVFSSSATVYGDPHTLPIKEDFPLSAVNPYSACKLFIENMLGDVSRSDEQWSAAILRFFNPVGAHESGRIGEDPNGMPNNLMPYIAQVAVGKQAGLSIYGDDYPTNDGTCVRDYIHVVDLAKGHIRALKKLATSAGCITYNLGTGKSYSVLEIVKAFEKASGREIPYRVSPRRKGDIAVFYGDSALAAAELNWKAEKGLLDMCKDTWRWQKNNPKGYG